MASPQPRKPEQQTRQEQTFSLQIPQRSTQQAGSSVIKIPNGYEINLSGTRVRVTSEITPERQMINISFDISGPSAPARSRSGR